VQSPPGSKYQTGYVEGIMYDTTQSTPTLKPEWKKVIEEFPDRFVLGSDINGGRFGDYDQVMNTFRHIILPGIPKDIAEKIAYKNAWKLMTGEDWKD
jgi:predicted TIM-barrel fold metal-dependent hydrolase